MEVVVALVMKSAGVEGSGGDGSGGGRLFITRN